MQQFVGQDEYTVDVIPGMGGMRRFLCPFITHDPVQSLRSLGKDETKFKAYSF
jgi:hypothetical protein